MKNLIKAKITKVAHRLFEAMPPTEENMETYQASPDNYKHEQWEKFLDVQNVFGTCAVLTLIITRDQKKARMFTLTGLIVGLAHVIDYENVKYHANKNK